INDRFGHPAGDAVLVEICQAIASQLREHDIFGRVGGEEFAITFIKSNAKEAGRTAERLRRHIEMLTISYEGQDISCTVSCGVSQFTPKDDLEKAMKRADAALYNAKNQGRNQVYLV
ncbi:MAG: GGDEF domain-containing protein, partial [Desulfobacteraceae bacterium]|nr:GGDEF domain-containing protein [Desulfobacteraceae bacterium]